MSEARAVRADVLVDLGSLACVGRAQVRLRRLRDAALQDFLDTRDEVDVRVRRGDREHNLVVEKRSESDGGGCK